MEEAKSLLRRVTKNGPVAIRMALESIYRGLDTATAEALDFESSLFGLLASTDDMREGMEAFLEKRKPDFKGE
jgi:enoyl-CoA hydratase